jgi:hypothetical protein
MAGTSPAMTDFELGAYLRALVRRFRVASVLFSQSAITPAMRSLFFSNIIMWPLPWMLRSASRTNVFGTPACVR